MSPSLLPLIFCLLLVLLQLNLSLAADASIKEACKAAAQSSPNVNYGFCVKSLKSDPESRSADTKGLAIIATKLSGAKSNSTKSKIDDLLKNATDPDMKQVLDTCSSLYSDLISTLKDSADALKTGRYADATTYLSAAMDQPGQCEDAFSGSGISSPVTKEDGDCTALCTISLSIAVNL